jgi:hypothetical protein
MTLNLLARLAFTLVLMILAAAQAKADELPPLPERNPARNPALVEAPADEQSVLPADTPSVPWSEDEVTAAKADCAKMLAALTLDYESLAPIKEGICGAPAPILLKAIGSEPKVEIDPPATVTCALAVAIGAWLGETVQPKARAMLGAPVVKLHNAASYTCRNRYGGETTPLSEHALANALDVSEFVFQSGERVTVLASWPHVVVAPPLPLPNPTRVAVVGDRAVSRLASADPAVATPAKAKPNALPQPPPAAAPPLPNRPPDAKSDFVRTVHDEACDIFGTVLGPEANEAHKDHFHFDMKVRRHSAFCE